MRKLFLSFFCMAIIITTQAQKKNFSYDQLFKGAATNITKPLPQITGWIDDDHYYELRKEDDGKTKGFSVDAKTGTAVASELTDAQKSLGGTRSSQQSPAPSIEGAINATVSPDKKWVAYTKKDNNLYVRDIETKKEIAITTDGSETILNGYASWGYY